MDAATLSEEWRTVPGHDGLYEVSDLGNVRSLPRKTRGKDGVQRAFTGKVLLPRVQKSGHVKVVLYRGDTKRSVFVHRLVAEAFIGPSGGRICRHLNDVPDDNRPANLAWGTYSDNTHDRVRNGNDPNARKTHCPQGHPYDRKNTFYGNHGERRCKACHRSRNLSWYHEAKKLQEV